MTVEALLWIIIVAGGLALAAMLLVLAAVVVQSLYPHAQEQALGYRLARPAVDQRVDEMLRDVLDEAEYHTLMTRDYLDVASSENAGYIYRIPRFGGMVTRYEYGRATIDLCVQPVDPLPGGDVVVLHKLMIQANEFDYVATARLYPSRYRGDAYRP